MKEVKNLFNKLLNYIKKPKETIAIVSNYIIKNRQYIYMALPFIFMDLITRFLGRNINFWIPIYDNIKSKLKLDIPVEEFVSYLNKAEPSFIRTEADELTYCLHIIIRYEIERDLFSNKISVNELPLIWNQKMQEYLGIQVNNDSDGILQDVHWSQGSFGYFPSYLIGSIFDGMLIESIEKNIGSIDEILRQGQIKKITKYLQDNIHKNGGAFTIKELTAKLCNQELTITPLVKYFKTKYENKEG